MPIPPPLNMSLTPSSSAATVPSTPVGVKTPPPIPLMALSPRTSSARPPPTPSRLSSAMPPPSPAGSARAFFPAPSALPSPSASSKFPPPLPPSALAPTNEHSPSPSFAASSSGGGSVVAVSTNNLQQPAPSPSYHPPTFGASSELRVETMATDQMPIRTRGAGLTVSQLAATLVIPTGPLGSGSVSGAPGDGEPFTPRLSRISHSSSVSQRSLPVTGGAATPLRLPPIDFEGGRSAAGSVAQAPASPLAMALRRSLQARHAAINGGAPEQTPPPAPAAPAAPPVPPALQTVDIDSALDVLEGYRHQFDMACQIFKADRHIQMMTIALQKVNTFLHSPAYQTILTHGNPAQVALVKGFSAAYTKEKEHLDEYLASHGQVLQSMLKMFISSTSDKVDKDSLRQVLHECRTFKQYGQIDDTLFQQVEALLTQVELHTSVLLQLQSATQQKDMDKLENYIARTHAAGMTADQYPELAAAEKMFQKLSKTADKARKKGNVTAITTFHSLDQVLSSSSFFVGLSSVLPLALDYKSCSPPTPRIRKATDIAPGTLNGIDCTVNGISNMPYLAYYLDLYVSLPLIMYDCLQHIRYSFAWTEEGIFRLSGGNDTIAHILIKYQHQHEQCVKNGGYIASEQGFLQPVYKGPFTEIQPTLLIQGFHSPHDATNVMKRWLRSLEEPIIPFDQYNDWIQVNSVPHVVTTNPSVVVPVGDDLLAHYKESERLKKLHTLIHRLPPGNVGMLQYLIMYLYCVSLNIGVNRMSSENLSIVIAPNLLRTAQESQGNAVVGANSPGVALTPQQLLSLTANNSMMQSSKSINEIIALLIKYAPVLLIPHSKIDQYPV